MRQEERCRFVVRMHDAGCHVATELLHPHPRKPERMPDAARKGFVVCCRVTPREIGCRVSEATEHGVRESGSAWLHRSHELNALAHRDVGRRAREEQLVG